MKRSFKLMEARAMNIKVGGATWSAHLAVIGGKLPVSIMAASMSLTLKPQL